MEIVIWKKQKINFLYEILLWVSVEENVKFQVLFIVFFFFILYRILDYINEQMKLWKKSLDEIQDKTINEITINK